MAQTLVEKILEPHRVSSDGGEIGIRIDQTLTQDATGTMAYLELEAIGIDTVRTELSVSYVDHNTLQCGYENADDHAYLRTVADHLGIVYSRAGNGICHQVHLERFAAPGKTLLGSDSHTPTGGGVGCLAIGAGGIDVAAAMAGEPFYLPEPQVLRVELTGALPADCEAKDIILSLLSQLTTKGNVGSVVEYGGPGVSGLSVPERATICNMGAELGVTTSLFPSDDVTRAFLAAQGREQDYVELQADPGAPYDRTLTIDLSSLTPLVAQPHSPDNVTSVAALEGMELQQVCIGSCTNASLYDMAVAHAILAGTKVPAHLDLVVVPGSRQVLLSMERLGMTEGLIEAGARIMEPTCGFCIGNGQSPPSGSKSLRTNNRNFYGRSGTTSAGIYLSGVKVAATSAAAGVLTLPTPREPSAIERDARNLCGLVLDDSMFIHPSGKAALIKGPNIGEPPEGTPLADTLAGEAALVVGDKITTDHIMPAGSRLKYRSNIAKYATFVFETVDSTFPERARALKEGGTAAFVIAGHSYGQGSSREHAAICPAWLGVRCVVAKSFERIHRANLINFGILPLTFEREEDYDAVTQGAGLLLSSTLDGLGTGSFILKNRTTGTDIPLTGRFSVREQRYLRAGGKLHAIGGV
jgi:aconitate hydratase